MNGVPGWRISDIGDESMGIWWHIDPSPIPTHFLVNFLISKPQTDGVNPQSDQIKPEPSWHPAIKDPLEGRGREL